MKTSSKKMLFVLGLVLGLISNQTARAQAALDSNNTTVYNTRSDASATFRLSFNVQVWYHTDYGQYQYSSYIGGYLTPGIGGITLAPAGQSGDSIDFSSELEAYAWELAQDDAGSHNYGTVTSIDFYSSWERQWFINTDS